MVERIEVPAATPYEVLIGESLDLGGAVSEVLAPTTGAILTDSHTGPLYADSVVGMLEKAGWRIADVIQIPAGEESKNLSTYTEVIRRLARSGMTRNGVLFALGGGVVGDLGGFVAGSYMRGIRFVQLPTSLLAMVDSSVGGKVGVDLPEGKNLVGLFLQPQLVVADLSWLESLPDRELSNGLAEVIKMGLLSGGEFFEGLDMVESAREKNKEALRDLVTYSVRFKAGVVADDELERGRRAILNYGHTIGHGLEAAAGYDLPHGEAISAGMVAEARLSRDRFGRDLVELHTRLLTFAGLPVKARNLAVEKVLNAMSRDKKRKSGEAGHRFVLLEDVGRPVWDVLMGEGEAREAVEEIIE